MFIMTCLAVFVSATIHSHLQEQLLTIHDDEYIAVIVHLKQKPDYNILSEKNRRDEKIKYLQENAFESQYDLTKYLALNDNEILDIKSFWIFNGVRLTTTKRFIKILARLPDIDYIIDDYAIDLDKNMISPEIERAPEWNISLIMADSCWNLGYDGSGIIVGNLDSGVDTAHPALQGKWADGGWFDAVNGLPDPYDDHGHGTFSMGIICGGDGPGPFTDDIGVAPGINYIVAKVFDSNGSAQLSWLHAGLQWIAVEKPEIVNNPWTINNTTSLEFWDDCLNLRAVGVYPVFRIGSNGPGSGTAGTPGNFPLVTGVGATDSLDNIASSSSRGPAPNQYPWNDTLFWSRPDWLLTKPDISAPGVNVRSADLGGGYLIMSGTSWATAHVTGALAILRQADSLITYDSLYQILLDYADHPSQGGTYPNNNYGWGRLNVFESLSELLSIEEKNTRIPLAKTVNVGATIVKGPLLPAEDKSYRIFDITGREIRTLDPAPGIYFIEVDGVVKQKVVKIR